MSFLRKAINSIVPSFFFTVQNIDKRHFKYQIIRLTSLTRWCLLPMMI